MMDDFVDECNNLSKSWLDDGRFCREFWMVLKFDGVKNGYDTMMFGVETNSMGSKGFRTYKFKIHA